MNPYRSCTIDELASILNCDYVLMLKAYFDESGLDGTSKVCVIAGFIGGARRWKQLEDNWLRILRDYDVKEFHATHFFAVHAGERQRAPYRDWTPLECDTFLKRLLVAIRSTQLSGIALSVPKADFASFTKQERRLITGAIIDDENWKIINSGSPEKPYFAIFAAALYTAMKCAPGDQPILSVFDLNDKCLGWAKEYFAKFSAKAPFNSRFKDLAFSPSYEHPGLQIADLLSYLWRKKIDSEMSGSQLKKYQAKALSYISKTVTTLDMNRETMQALLDRLGVPDEIRKPLAMKRANDN